MNRYPPVSPAFLLTVDIEDWFQVENFKSAIPFSSWENLELRVEKNTHTILDLLDEMHETDRRDEVTKSRKADEKTDSYSFCSTSDRPNFGSTRFSATFFILGWIAKRRPGLVREIHNRGHEVASHGFNHRLCQGQDRAALRADLSDSKKLLEDITGSGVYGYRAPSFTVDNDILKIIEEAGYRYDASYNSFDKHGRYGKLNLDHYRKQGIAYRLSDTFHEIPVSNLSLRPSSIVYHPSVLPWSGGGYFRLIPLPVFKKGVKHILKRENAYHFYCHPWEIDPDQPRVNGVSRMFRFRHYVNIGKTLGKLRNLVSSFGNCRFIALSEYLMSLEQGAGSGERGARTA